MHRRSVVGEVACVCVGGCGLRCCTGQASTCRTILCFRYRSQGVGQAGRSLVNWSVSYRRNECHNPSFG